MSKIDIFQQFATDETKELEGAWVELSPDTKLLIARVGNKKYNRLLAKLVEEKRRMIDSKDEDVSDEAMESILVDVMAKTVLIGWEGLLFRGEELEYNEANAKALLALKDFRKQVAAFSENFDNYRRQDESETVKKS